MNHMPSIIPKVHKISYVVEMNTKSIYAEIYSNRSDISNSIHYSHPDNSDYSTRRLRATISNRVSLFYVFETIEYMNTWLEQQSIADSIPTSQYVE